MGTSTCWSKHLLEPLVRQPFRQESVRNQSRRHDSRIAGGSPPSPWPNTNGGDSQRRCPPHAPRASRHSPARRGHTRAPRRQPPRADTSVLTPVLGAAAEVLGEAGRPPRPLFSPPPATHAWRRRRGRHGGTLRRARPSEASVFNVPAPPGTRIGVREHQYQPLVAKGGVGDEGRSHRRHNCRVSPAHPPRTQVRARRRNSGTATQNTEHLRAATGTSGVRAGSTGEGECTSRLAAPAARRRHWHAGGCVGGGTWSPYAAAAAAVSRKARKGRYGGKGRTERPAAARVDSAVPPRGGPLTPARAGGGQHARGGATDGGGGGGRRRATGSGPARAPAREDSVGGAPPSRGIRCGHLRNGRAGAHTIIDARQGAGGTSSAAAGSAAALSRVAEASHGLRRGQSVSTA